jgi:hypothetical protein
MRLAFPLAAALAATLAAAPSLARACSVCACGDPLLTAGDPAAIAGRLRVQVDTEFLRVDAGNEADPTRTDRLTQWSYRLNSVWRPIDTLAFSATLPVVSKSMRMVGGGMPAESTSSATGLGDLEAAVRWAPFRSVDLGTARVHEVALSLGTSMPTGANGLRQGGERIDEHGQPGTGAWGPFAGVHYRFEQGDWTAFASVSGRVRTENGYGYTYGRALLWSVHGQRFLGRRVAVELGVDGRYAAADRADAAAVENTGGSVLSLSPGVYAKPAGGAWVFARAQLPFVARLRGEQAVYPTVTLGVQLEVL